MPTDADRLKARIHYQSNKHKSAIWSRRWRLKNRDVLAQYQRNRAKKLRDIIINFYSSGKIRCNCCKYNDIRFLAIDHIIPVGNKERRKYGIGIQYYKKIIRDGFPPKYQILCHNCNLAKGSYGDCPHEKPLDWMSDLPTNLQNKSFIAQNDTVDKCQLTLLPL